MKQIFTLLIILIFFTCKKDSEPAISTPQQTQKPSSYIPPAPGRIIFYAKDSSYAHQTASKIDIWFDWAGQNCYSCPQYMGQIGYFISWGTPPPNCGNTFFLNYSDTLFQPIKYHARAVKSPYKIWDGTVTPKSGECIKIEFFTHD